MTTSAAVFFKYRTNRAMILPISIRSIPSQPAASARSTRLFCGRMIFRPWCSLARRLALLHLLLLRGMLLLELLSLLSVTLLHLLFLPVVVVFRSGLLVLLFLLLLEFLVILRLLRC